TEIYPLLCSRTEKQHFRLERLNAIIISAMLQSQQAWLPTLLQPLSFNNIVVDKKDYNIKLIAHCNLKEKVPLQKISIKENTMLLIGPEGDFTEDEIFLAEKNNFIAVSLGNNRFRTETAGIAAAVLLKLNN
ncbi:MAG TPA: RsmE family RNA methyltransferase, partial [Chitinophagaceae bacterium]|nr:RsmE family RNA methyltransferase [Chitinophagaceae bacterium]